MKRGTINHPKMRLLAKELNIPICQAVGLLECLWHFTAQSAKRGNVGKSTNAEIAEACYWPGDPDKLIKAFIKTRWIDENAEYRLIVHDWQDHADDTVKLALKRKDETFAILSNHVATSSDKNPLPMPMPEPMPMPKNKNVGRARKPRTTQRTDEQFIEHLKSNPAYAGIDVDRELHKMDPWLAARPGRKKTRRFIVNWLNKCDKPVATTAPPEKPRVCFECGKPATMTKGREWVCSEHF